MKIFFDTEFIDSPPLILPISIGLIREDGKEYYAEFAETDLSMACSWVTQNVINKLTGPRKSKEEIARDLVDFCGKRPDFWAWFGSYDWVVLCQLYGRMLDVPNGWPHFYNELVMYSKFKRPFPISLKDQIMNPNEHHALHDARWNRDVFNYLNQIKK